LVREGFYGVNGIECPVIYETKGEGIPVLLLHGYNFTSTTWREVGIIEALENKGIDYAAPDMPYGKRTSCSKKTRDLIVNLRALEKVVERLLMARAPLIIGASLGGRIALYYAANHSVKGLLLASPAVKRNEDIWKLTRSIKAPTMIIRGSRDFIPLDIHKRLAEMLNARLVIYDSVGHVVYRDNPRKFVEDLFNFYEDLTE
jgi:pimeloyl-ACP methyl ester carboxylesterase